MHHTVQGSVSAMDYLYSIVGIVHCKSPLIEPEVYNSLLTLST